MSKHQTISASIVRRAAASANTDVATARLVALGIPVVGDAIVRDRIVQELRRLGIEPPLLQTADQIENAPGPVAGGGS